MTSEAIRDPKQDQLLTLKIQHLSVSTTNLCKSIRLPLWIVNS